MPTYDPKKQVASWGNITLGDFAQDTFIKVTRDADDFELRQGAGGFTEFTNKNSAIHTIEFTVMQTSPINDRLSAALADDRLNNTGVAPFMIKDAGPGGSTLIAFREARISKPADGDMGGSTKDRVWVLKAGAPSEYNIGGIV